MTCWVREHILLTLIETDIALFPDTHVYVPSMLELGSMKSFGRRWLI